MSNNYISFCLKCKKKVEVKDLAFHKTNSKNKMHMYIGRCTECGGKVVKLLKEKL